MRLDRKAFGRVATTFVATAMLAAFAAVPASAADRAANEFTITKTFTVAANTFRPAADFSFIVNAATVTPEQEAQGFYDGIADAVKMKAGGAAHFNADIGTTPSTMVSTTADATFEVTFGAPGTTNAITHAGVYKYTVQETDSGMKGVSYDTTAYDLYITVENDSSATATHGLKVASWQMTKTVGQSTEKVNGITNTYDNDTDDDGDPDFYQLTVQKTMDGTGADLSAEFDFTIAITGSSNDTTQYYYTTSNNEKGVILANGTPQTVTLSKDETVTVYGLFAEDQYAITETQAGQNNYTTSAKKEDDTTYGDYNENGTVLKNTMSGADTNADKSVNVFVQNYRDLDEIPSTGIIMNVAPYALMVIIAAAGCFVFLRKRRDD